VIFLIRVYSWLKIFWRFGLLLSVVSVVVCSPTNWCPSPTTAAREPARTGSQSPLVFFFENFAPPFPEKEVRDGKHPKKSQKIMIDFIYETCDLSRP
jgi:hypothetical protein